MKIFVHYPPGSIREKELWPGDHDVIVDIADSYKTGKSSIDLYLSREKHHSPIMISLKPSYLVKLLALWSVQMIKSKSLMIYWKIAAPIRNRNIGKMGKFK